MSLIEECNKHLKDLEAKGIKYPDPVYCHAKMIKATVESASNVLGGIKGGK